MTQKIIKFDAPELDAIEKSKADQIRATFEPMGKMLSEFETAFNEVVNAAKKEVTRDVTVAAKRLRIEIGKVRISTEKIRKDQKEEYLRAGKAIDGVSNILKWAVSDKEEKLKEIENHFEILEQRKREALQTERVSMLLPYVDDADQRNLYHMDTDVWEAYFHAKKKEYTDRLAAEKKAEEDRIAKEKAEAAERLRIQKEVDRLKAQATEAKKVEEERIRLAKIENEKREKENAIILAEQKAERASFEAKLKAEREEKQRIENELREKQEAERQAKMMEEAKRQAELSKGDAEKVKDLIADLNAIKGKYSFSTPKCVNMYGSVNVLINRVINFIHNKYDTNRN